ncbi:hypothetical protein CAY35_06700, partial [Pseudoglutamicibacter cumminsii]
MVGPGAAGVSAAPGETQPTDSAHTSTKTAYTADGKKLDGNSVVTQGDEITYAVSDKVQSGPNLPDPRVLTDTMSSNQSYVKGSLTELNEGNPGLKVFEPSAVDWSKGQRIAAFTPTYGEPATETDAGTKRTADPLFGQNAQYAEGVAPKVSGDKVVQNSDGFNPTIAYNKKGEQIVWSITHHEKDATLGCQFVGSRDNCSSAKSYWGSEFWTQQNVPTITRNRTTGLMSLNKGVGNYFVGVVDFADVAPGVPPKKITKEPVQILSGTRGEGIVNFQASGLFESDGKYYMIGRTEGSKSQFKLGCFDADTNAVCEGFSPEGNLVATDDFVAKAAEMRVYSEIHLAGGKIAFTTAPAGNNAQSALWCVKPEGNTMVNCDGSATIKPLKIGDSYTAVPVVSKDTSGTTIVPEVVNEGQERQRVSGFCSGPLGNNAKAKECFDLNGKSIGMPYPGLPVYNVAHTRLHDAFAYPANSAQAIYPLSYGNNRATCYDFEKKALCDRSVSVPGNSDTTWLDEQTIKGTKYQGKIYGARMIPGSSNCMVSLGDTATFLFWTVDANGKVTPAGNNCQPLSVNFVDQDKRYCAPGDNGMTEWGELKLRTVKTGTAKEGVSVDAPQLEFYEYDAVEGKQTDKLIGRATMQGSGSEWTLAKPEFLNYKSTKNFTVRVVNAHEGATYQFTQHHDADAQPSVCYKARVIQNCAPEADMKLTNKAVWSTGSLETRAPLEKTAETEIEIPAQPGEGCFKVQKESITEQVKTKEGGTWSADYKITVTNTDKPNLTSEPVTDKPTVPAGFTITEVKVDGKAVTRQSDGMFTVSEGVNLDGGASKSFTITLSGDVAESGVDWTAAGECDITGEGNPKKGLFNLVVMNGDGDGPENNDACVPVIKEDDPVFKVKKDSASAGAKAENGEWTSAYTVTVTNDGEIEGTSKAVTDTPSVPEGFKLEGATVDGETVELVDGSFTVTEGVELAAGKDKVFEVVLSGTYDAASADWVAVGECETEGEGNPDKGLFNKVTLEGDSDGPENNDACNPVGKDPSFKVKKDSAEAGATAADGEWTSAYTVTVTNDGEIAGTSKAVTDTPSVPEGFKLEGATVDGEAVEITDGTFTVTDGVKLAAGKEKQFEVVLSGTYEADKADWVAVGECDVTGEGDPAKGLFNKVTMEGDSDGPENNDACNPVGKDPSFKVKKDSASAGAKAENGEWTSAYTVTVTNDGEIEGTSKVVTDTPSVPEGFKVTGAKVDGTEVEITDGTFTVTDGVKLDAGKDKQFEVVLSGTYDADKADWVAVGECDITGEGDPAKGLFNKVTMEEDSDGPENNEACNPVGKDPSFKVKKDSAEAGATAADGEWTSAYTVTVTNDGEVAGTSKAVTDTPSVPAGFKVTGAKVDGEAVELVDGSFTVTDGVKLAAGENKQFEVVLSGTYEADKADWVAVGECDITGEGDSSKGLFNKVTMEGDSDGPENNDACNPVGKDPSFKVKKDSAEAGAKVADGEWTSAYTVTVTNDGEIAGTSKAVTDTPSVPEGFELTEAKVDGETVELVDGSFTVTDGVKLAAGENKVFEVVLSGTYEAGKADWVAVGECETEGEGDPAKGLFNKVTMEGDSDGPENNDACNPVSKDPAFAVKKDADTTSVVTSEGKTWKATYTVTVSNTGDIAGTSKAVTDTPSVPEGFTVTG